MVLDFDKAEALDVQNGFKEALYKVQEAQSTVKSNASQVCACANVAHSADVTVDEQ